MKNYTMRGFLANDSVSYVDGLLAEGAQQKIYGFSAEGA
jgi:hypothetical protein